MARELWEKENIDVFEELQKLLTTKDHIKSDLVSEKGLNIRCMKKRRKGRLVTRRERY